jgi:F-type H+-transporting ATPase subunit epsilon
MSVMGESKSFKLDLLASDRKFFSGDCEHLVFPSIDGLDAILPGHQKAVTVIRAGEMKFMVDGEWHYAAVGDGIIEITPHYVLVLSETIEKPEEIDKKREEYERDRALEKLRQKQSIREYYITSANLRRAMTRLKIKSKFI